MQFRRIGICFGNRPIADFSHDQTIFLKDYELYIIGQSLIAGELDLSQIRCYQDALEESNRLQEVFDKNVVEINEKRSKNWKISYLNIRSLRAHQEDVRKDNFLIDSDILGFGETHLNKDETVYFDGF